MLFFQTLHWFSAVLFNHLISFSPLNMLDGCPPKDTFKQLLLGSQVTVTLFGDRVFADAIQLRILEWDHHGLSVRLGRQRGWKIDRQTQGLDKRSGDRRQRRWRWPYHTPSDAESTRTWRKWGGVSPTESAPEVKVSEFNLQTWEQTHKGRGDQ